MVELVQEENERLKEELAGLRQAILQVDPSILLDGRFEQMITTPITVIAVARELISQIPEIRQAGLMVVENA
ncbi:MAG: hypothetical protein R3C44_08790 [Chloroflexota bacterium]